MELTIFSKKRTSKEGKPFSTFLTTLTKKDGTTVTASVKFRDTCEMLKPEACPSNIIVDREGCNLASKTYVKESTGEVGSSYTLWVSNYREGSPYVDHSLDDFDI